MKLFGVFAILISVLVFMAAGQAAEIERYQVPIGDSPSMGPADAPVTIIEFLDYQ